MTLRVYPRRGFYHLTIAAAVALLMLTGIAHAGLHGDEAGQSAAPGLTYSTYLGGSDDEGDWLYGAVVSIAVDAAGNAYVAGTTRSLDFPTTPGGDRAIGGDQDIFVTKLSPTGAVLYSTYVGGPCDDVARAIALDAAGNVYVTGRAHDGVCTENVSAGVLVAKLDATGALVYSFVFGGSLADSSIGQAIAVDASGRAHVAGIAQSATRDFPSTPGAYRTSDCGTLPEAWGGDGFVAKVNAAGTGLVYATYLCGNSHESPNGIALDAAGHAYVAGSTDSHDFPTVNAFQPTHPGGTTTSSGFVAKLSADGSALLYSTYLGGSIEDVVQGIAVDAAGHAYVTGATDSSDFPTTPGALQQGPGDWACGWTFCTHAFVTKIAPAGNALVYSTYVSGESDDIATRIAIDGAGNAHVVGRTASLYFPIVNAAQSEKRGLDDAFVLKLSADGTRLLWSTYLGGSRGETTSLEGFDGGSAIAVDATGHVLVAGTTMSRDFPTTPGAFQPGLGGGICDYFGSPCGDAFVAKLPPGPGVVPLINLVVTPWELAPGAAFTATWAGLPMPTPNDELRLYPLGATPGEWNYVGSWPTTGATAGTLTLTLPNALAAGTYELRLMSGDPDAGNLLQVRTRSRPIRVGAPSPDLVVAEVATIPTAPVVGQAVAVTVTVANVGAAATGGFVVDFYKNRATAPGAGTVGDVRCAVAGLVPGARAQCAGTVTYATAGTATTRAQVDTGHAVVESNEDNNVAGPRAIVVGGPLADLIVVAIGNPPGSAAPGAVFTSSETARNQGAGGAIASKTRYYLSLDGAHDAADTLLTGNRSVPALAAGAQSAGAVTLTIPAATALGSYRLLACADDTGLVAEASEGNNCLASAATIVVGRPDLASTAVSNPPAAARAGTTFTVTDSVKNQGTLAASASTTRYYLSLDPVRSAEDRLLTGSRAVAVLAAGATSTHTVTVTIPSATPPGTYFVLACADDARAVAESDEGNNCRASVATLAIALPDLAQQAVSNGAGPVRRGTAFTVSDTVVNTAPVAVPRSTTTRYYLSADAVRNTGDRLLSGARAIPILAPSAVSSGSVSVVVPSSTPPGTYVVLACADDTLLVGESTEANNCRASTTALVVSP